MNDELMESQYEFLYIISDNRKWYKRNASRISEEFFDKIDALEIYKAILKLGDNSDMISVTEYLRNIGKLDKVGGPSRISEIFLTNSPATDTIAEYRLQELTNKLAKKRCKQLLKDGLASLNSTPLDGLTDIINTLVTGLSSGAVLRKRLPVVSSKQAMERVIEGIEYRVRNPGIPGITTGFPAIDKKTYGLQEGHVWVISGNPGGGKSVLMQNLLEPAAVNEVSVGVYQLEMTIEEQAFRFLSSDSLVDNENLWIGKISRAEMMQIQKSINTLKELGVDYIDTDDADTEDILSDIAASDYRVVMLDYLQLLRGKGGDNREQYLADVSGRLKKIAKKTKKTIITGSQLNDDGLLRESRAIGQDADKVFRIKSFVSKDKEVITEKRILECLKNRGGPPSWSLEMDFLGNVFKFKES
jgi:replicative DNA helicase